MKMEYSVFFAKCEIQKIENISKKYGVSLHESKGTGGLEYIFDVVEDDLKYHPFVEELFNIDGIIVRRRYAAMRMP